MTSVEPAALLAAASFASEIAAASFETASAAAPFTTALAAFATFDPEPAHVVGTGGAIGAILRHLVYRHLPQDRFPAATLTVNVVGSFVFGAAVFAGAGASTIRLVGIGICGSFTTFSTFSVETVQLWERGERRLAVGHAAANLLVSLAAIGLAWLLVAALA